MRYLVIMVHKGKSMYNLLKDRLYIIDKVKLDKMKTAKEFSKLLFNDIADYSKGGYINVIKI